MLLPLLFAPLSFAQEGPVLEGDALRVRFSEGRRAAAQQILEASPTLFRALERDTGLPFDLRPTVIAAPSRSAFRQLGGRQAFLAFAVPARHLVVLDLSRFDLRPASFQPVLKHEYAHLLLHRHIPMERLPRWLDEGIAQHLSDGLSEYLPGRAQLILGEALAADRVFPLAALSKEFPSDDTGLQLAYEQSRSVVGYLVERFGDAALRGLVARLAAGQTPGEALPAEAGISLDSLEADWRRHESTAFSWLGRVAGHVYGVLFFLAALATLGGFVRHLRRKRAYDAGEDEAD
jgi:hypothetical protein